MATSDETDAKDSAASSADPTRRRFVTRACAVGMTGALAASYGTFFAFAGRFLYPAKPPPTGWLFVREMARFHRGQSLVYRTPAGAPVTVARQRDTGGVEDFVALSSTCPHLGCQVHWEGQNNRFFCPCHNGTFDPQGNPTGGPPADAGQPLPKYPLKIENGLLYIQVELDSLPAVAVDDTALPMERNA